MISQPPFSTVGVSGNVEVTNDVGNSIPVSGTVTLGAGSASVGTVGVSSLPSLPTGTNQIGTVEITNDVGNAIPVNLPIRTPLLAYYASSLLYQTFATLIQPLDVTNIASVQISVSSLSTSAQISLQTSSDGGANWNFISYLSVGTATYTTASNSNGPTYIRIAAASSATAGSTIITVNGTTASYVQSYLDNPAPSVIPFNSSATTGANAILVGPIYCGNYRSGSVIISSAGTGMSLNAQVSLDGTNYVNVGTWLMSGNQSQSTGMGATGTMYSFVLAGAMYFRVITSTAITSGTSTFWVSLSTNQGFGPAVGTVSANILPTTASGSSNYANTVAAATSNLVAVKATAANISSIWGFAKTGVTNYLKIFNTNAPTLGTTVPVLNIPINGNLSFNCGFAGIRLSAGFAYAITLNAAPLDTTAVALAGDSVVNFVYT